MMPPEIISTTPFPAVSTVRERPILFSAPMVRALLAGTKRQTRRVVKTPERYEGGLQNCLHCCPYGQPGDRLWVRENGWQRPADRAERGWSYAYDADAPFGIGAANEAYREEGWKRRPSIHMPRWASRILLEVTDVRVERLQDISEADALAEGVRHSYGEPFDAIHTISDRRRYEPLLEQINGPGSWAANPWVWAVSFRLVPPNGGISETPPGGSTA